MTGWQTLFYKEVLRFWKVSFQTIAAPVLTAVLYMLIFGHDQLNGPNRRRDPQHRAPSGDCRRTNHCAAFANRHHA